MKPTFGSLFAGVGGFDMGMEQAGWECLFQVEWDKNCQHILNRHWPDVPKWGDVSTVSGTEIPPVDCIIFGSPCQDLSVAGKRAGLEGERSGLFHEAVRIIKEMRDVTNGAFPRWAIWENVAGALSSNAGRDFATVINEMAEAGAVLQEFAVLDAQHFGIPQRRRRVFVIAIFDPAIALNCPDPLLPVSESVRRDSAKGKPKGQAASRTLTEGVGGDGAIVNAITASIYHKSTVVNQDVNSGHLVVGALAARDYKGVGSQYVDEGKVIVEPMLFENSRRDAARIAHDGISHTLQRHMGTGGGNTPMIAIGIQGNVIGRQDHNGPAGKGHTEAGDPMFTLTKTDIHAVAFSHTQGLSPQASEDAWPTLRSGGGGHGVLEPTMAVRRLTPLECERLMGWPDDHTRYNPDGSEQADTHRYKQCGNGVASPVARWIAEHILKANQ